MKPWIFNSGKENDMSLYLKYRPTTLEDLIGNSDVVEILSDMLANTQTCPHAFLLHGPTGCGKTTIGRIIARTLGSAEDDIQEIDTADFRGIETVREIRRQSRFLPMGSKCQVWIIDECHKLTGDAQSAMLKMLEDTPEHVYFILCTTDPQKLLSTIKGRCSALQVNQLNETEMFRLLRRTVKAEKTELDKAVYEQITQDSLGHPRNALVILDQVLRVDPEKRLAVARRTAEEQSQSIELCRALVKAAGWKTVAGILSGMKTQEPERIRQAVLGYCQAILLKGAMHDQCGVIMEFFEKPFFASGFPGLTLACYSSIVQRAPGADHEPF